MDPTSSPLRRRNGPSPEEPVSALRHVPIRENGEPLIDFLPLSGRLYWAPKHPVYEYERFRLARRTVAEMLAAAAESLPAGLRLAVVEGWRAPAIQQQMHQATLKRVREEHPDWSPAHVTRYARRFSAPMDRRAPPPHTTGGAVDVHIVDESGVRLDFVSPYEMLDRRSARAVAPRLSAEARRNRGILQQAMGGAGFTNYPSEWWHWSYGDQGWAYRGGHPEAIYGAIEPEGLAEANFNFRRREDPGL